MSLDAFDGELDNHLEELSNECNFCSAPIEEDKNWCSASCRRYDNE